MRRPILGSSVVLLALAALCAMGIAFQSDEATGRILSDPIVDPLGQEELAKFAVVDLGDALDHVVKASAEE